MSGGDWTPPPPPEPLTAAQQAAALAVIQRVRGVPCAMNSGSEPLGRWWMCATYELAPEPIGPIVWAWVGPDIATDASAIVVEGAPLMRAQLRQLLAQLTPDSGLTLSEVLQVVVQTDGKPLGLSTIANGDPQGQRRELLPHLHAPRREKTPEGRRLAFFATDASGATRRYTCLVDGEGGIGLQADTSVPTVAGHRSQMD